MNFTFKMIYNQLGTV